MKLIRKHLYKMFIAWGMLCTVLGFQNCSRAAFQIDPVAKHAAIAGARVFGGPINNNDNEADGIDNNDNQADDGPGNNNGDDEPDRDGPGSNNGDDEPDRDGPGSNNGDDEPDRDGPGSNNGDDEPDTDGPGSNTGDDEPDTDGSGNIALSPRAVCGPAIALNQRASLLKTKKVVAGLFDVTNFWVTRSAPVIQVWNSATDSANILAALKAKRAFNLPLKGALIAGHEYTVVIYDADTTSLPLKYEIMDGGTALAPLTDSVASVVDHKATFIADKSGLQPKALSMRVLVGIEGTPECNNVESIDPLVIQLKTAVPQPIVLTSAANGVMFDIMGYRNDHKPVKTAWFATSVAENYFLVLPNGQGKVLGINELFGDATLGPDKKFAKQGFAALRKWDDNDDRIISEEDSVFASLRLWKDANLDGIAQSTELHTLAAKEVVAIDLRYDRRYKEVDQHGNMTKYKSIVVMKDNSYGLAYDLYLTFLRK